MQELRMRTLTTATRPEQLRTEEFFSEIKRWEETQLIIRSAENTIRDFRVPRTPVQKHLAPSALGLLHNFHVWTK